MQTVTSMSERLDMSAEDAVEKLLYMLFDVNGIDDKISDEMCDLLIDVDDDPAVAEEVRDKKLKEKERAQKAKRKAVAKRKATAKKKADAKKKAEAAEAKAAAEKKKAAIEKRKANEKAKEEAKDAIGDDLKEEAKEEAEIVAEESVSPVAADDAEILEPVSEILESVAPAAEILSPDVVLTDDVVAAEAETSQEGAVGTAPVAKAPKKKKERKKKEPAEPSFSIGSAIEHEEHVAEIVRADGTHVDVVEVEITDTPDAEDRTDVEYEVGLLAEAERRHEEEELRKARTTQPMADVKPDPAVVAEVIRKANMNKAKPRPKPRPAQSGTRKTGKTARKRQKKMERLRVEENLRREAAAAVREYQAVGSTKKKRKKRRGEDGDGDVDVVEVLVIEVEDVMTVEELAQAMDVDTTDIILELMELNIMANKNQTVSIDLIREIAEPRGFEVQSIIPMEQEVLAEEEDDEEKLLPRAPVVTVMGHVDHGKTSLLDRVRTASVAEGEAGGITQHIAAYEVELPQGRVVFLDTPGHEAFTAMRARGAQVTDVVVLVVAADDGVMPQTIEAIDHAKEAEVPVVVAINKVDKANAQPERIRQELARFDLIDEQWGGKTIMKEISALTGDGVSELMELLVLETELLELKANPDKKARGTVVESEITRGQGPVAWVLVQSGTLRVGDSFLAGETYGRVRAMQNTRGESVEEASSSTPVVVMGFDKPAAAGDLFVTVAEERVARSIAAHRSERSKKRQGPAARHVTLEDFHAQLLAGEVRELNLLIKADVQGSTDVLKSSLAGLGNEEVQTRIVHSGVGAINESDILLASASGAVIIGFHIDASPKVEKLAELEGVAIRTYSVIYEAINDVTNSLEGLLAPEQVEVVTGHAEIRAIFKSSALGQIAGCYVTDGEMRRDALARVWRGKETVYEGKILSLKREKDDAQAVQSGFECGIKLDDFNAIAEGDIVEAYRVESVAKTLA